MRAYTESDEEALRALDLLKDWRGEELLTADQHQRMQQETVCELRRTNIFLRLVLFFFTWIIVGGAIGLFFTVFLSNPGEQTAGIFLLIFAGLSYAAAEVAVSQYRLYRYGIEEALAVCSVAFLCVGMGLAFSSGPFSATIPREIESLVQAAGAIGSLWLWRRFGLPYAPIAAIVFVVWLPGYWTSSPTAQHLMLAAFYLVGLAAVIPLRPRHRLTYLDGQYSFAEALLWVGVYLAINLQLSPENLLAPWSSGYRAVVTPFPKPFYWMTWVLTWCLPPVVLTRGLRGKDRFVIAAGGITAILTFVTNKPYLGWPRHTWDPMLLGALLVAVALFIRRWLAQAPGGVRKGFTAQRLSGKDKGWMSLGSAAIGLVSPGIVAPRPQPSAPEAHFGGGDSGGGGASSDF